MSNKSGFAFAEEAKVALDADFLSAARDFHAMKCISRLEKQVRLHVDENEALKRSKLHFEAMAAIMQRRYEEAVDFFIESGFPTLAVELFIRFWKGRLLSLCNCAELIFLSTSDRFQFT